MMDCFNCLSICLVHSRLCTLISLLVVEKMNILRIRESFESNFNHYFFLLNKDNQDILSNFVLVILRGKN